MGSRWRIWPAPLTALRWGSLLAPVAIGLIWGVISYRLCTEETIEHAQGNAMLIRLFTERLLSTQTQIQDAVEQSANIEGAGHLEGPAFEKFLDGMHQSNRGLGIAVMSFDGAVIAANSSNPLRRGLLNRSYLDAIQKGEPIFIDRIQIGPKGEDTILVARKFTVGNFIGVIVSSIPTEALRRFLECVAADEGEAASLLRSDGMLLVRKFPTPAMLLKADSIAMRAIGKANSGEYETPSRADGVNRIYSFAKMPKLPMVAVFGSPTKAITTDWLTENAPVQGMLLALGAFGFILAGKVQADFTMRAAVLQASTERTRRDEAERLAEDRKRLMQELHHRVTNNLTLVEALIGMQMRKNEAIDGQELRARIQAISGVHDVLYKAGSAFHVDIAVLLQNICASPAVVPTERPIGISCKIHGPILLNASRATPLALVATELITNAVKHAFACGTTNGQIEVWLGRDGEMALLTISDNGVGLPQYPSRNSGLDMVRAFVQQIEGDLRVMSKPGSGARFEIRFVEDEDVEQFSAQ